MAYYARVHLKWGNGTLAPGEKVPTNEPGRNYESLLRLGYIEYVEERKKGKKEAAVASPPPSPSSPPKPPSPPPTVKEGEKTVTE
jgi:hypothetical protein